MPLLVMKKHLILWPLFTITLLFLFLVLPGMSKAGRQIQVKDSGQNIIDKSATTNLTTYFSQVVTGGYTAQGVGMRNRGFGTISVDKVPAGAQVYKAYLYWTVIGPTENEPSYRTGNINGQAITGITNIGTSSNPDSYMNISDWRAYSYRADVTAKIAGNGNYLLSGFPSGEIDGRDPSQFDNAPLMEGASLVIIFKKTGYPRTRVIIKNGGAYLGGGNAVTTSFGLLGNSTPRGVAYTTFIGADGEDTYEPSSLFRGYSLGGLPDWDGTDPQAGPDFPGGNFWDTDTVKVGAKMKAGVNNTINVTVRSYASQIFGSSDKFIWVAQVFSLSAGNIDSDKDKLLDSWENLGHDIDGNGSIDLDLPGYGADYLHKDIFVEADWMNGAHDHKLQSAAVDRAISTFQDAPLTNPDGINGVNLHIDTGNLGGGNAITHDTYLGTSGNNCARYDWTEFQSLKSKNMSNKRYKVFHYMIMAHNLAFNCGSVSGMSRGIPASDFIVSLGGWSGSGTENARVGTFIHELGHNLGLKHGGSDHTNYKPNYLSVMNYFFQVDGIPRTTGPRAFDYSRSLLYSLNENVLNEANGLGHDAYVNGYGTSWVCPNRSVRTKLTASANIDWDCDGNASETSVIANINNHAKAPSTLGTLTTQNNWANIIFDGGLVGPGLPFQIKALPMKLTPVAELTFEEHSTLSQKAR